jgi:hypothetical protein
MGVWPELALITRLMHFLNANGSKVWLIRAFDEARLLDEEAVLPSGNRGVIWRGRMGKENRREPHARNTRRFPTPPGFARCPDQYREDCIFPKEALLKRAA